MPEIITHRSLGDVREAYTQSAQKASDFKNNLRYGPKEKRGEREALEQV